MQITWHGLSLFQITTSPEKNVQIKITIDPFDKTTGLRVPKMDSDILLITNQHNDYNNAKAVAGNPFIIENPGEYEVKNIFIQGISTPNNNSKEKGRATIYTIESEGLRICHLGNLDQRELTEEQLERIGDIDILMISVGGIISGQESKKIISQLEPKIIIPMRYAIPKLKTKLNPLSDFLKAMGIKSIEPIKKLSIKKKDLLSDEAKIIVLEQ